MAVKARPVAGPGPARPDNGRPSRGGLLRGELTGGWTSGVAAVKLRAWESGS